MKKDVFPFTDKLEGEMAVLYGVSKVGYYVEHREITPFISSLKSFLAYMGQKIPYCILMAASGAAFRLIWNRTFWDEANVNLMRMWKNPLLPHIKALSSAGRGFRIILRKEFHKAYFADDETMSAGDVSFGDKGDFINLIKCEIDAGRPVIGFGVIGPPEACIITGYKQRGETLLGWNYFQDMIDYAGDIQKEPCGYFVKENWYENPNTIAVMAIGDIKGMPDERMIFTHVLEQALEIMSPRAINEASGGLKAFEEWIASITDNSQFTRNAPWPMLYNRLICQTDAEAQVGEGRYYAAMYLEYAKELFPEISKELEKVINIFKQEVTLIEKMIVLHEGSGFGEKHITALHKPEVRKKIARLIQDAAELEAQALHSLKGILKIIKRNL